MKCSALGEFCTHTNAIFCKTRHLVARRSANRLHLNSHVTQVKAKFQKMFAKNVLV